MDAVAPVTIRLGGCGESSTASSSRGRAFLAKLNRPELVLSEKPVSYHSRRPKWKETTHACAARDTFNSSTLLSRKGLTENALPTLNLAAASLLPGNSFFASAKAEATLSADETSVLIPIAFPPALLLSSTMPL